VHDRRSDSRRLTEKGINLRDSLTTMHGAPSEMLSEPCGELRLQSRRCHASSGSRAFGSAAADLVQRPAAACTGGVVWGGWGGGVGGFFVRGSAAFATHISTLVVNLRRELLGTTFAIVVMIAIGSGTFQKSSLPLWA